MQLIYCLKISKNCLLLFDLIQRILKSLEKKNSTAREMVAQALKNLVLISNSNIIQNADYLLSKMEVEAEVKLIGKNKIRVNSSKYKITYWLF